MERSLIARIEGFLGSMGGMFAFMGSQYRLGGGRKRVFSIGVATYEITGTQQLSDFPRSGLLELEGAGRSSRYRLTGKRLIHPPPASGGEIGIMTTTIPNTTPRSKRP